MNTSLRSISIEWRNSTLFLQFDQLKLQLFSTYGNCWVFSRVCRNKTVNQTLYGTKIVQDLLSSAIIDRDFRTADKLAPLLEKQYSQSSTSNQFYSSIMKGILQLLRNRNVNDGQFTGSVFIQPIELSNLSFSYFCIFCNVSVVYLHVCERNGGKNILH